MHLIRIIRETGGVVYRQPNAAVALDNDDIVSAAYDPSVSQSVFTISRLKAPTSAFTFKTLCQPKRPSIVTLVWTTQFHIYLQWGQCLFIIVS